MITSLLNTPWKYSNEISRLLLLPYVRLTIMLSGINWGQDWRFHSIPIIQKHRQSVMRFGRGLGLRSDAHANPLGPNHPVILCIWQAGAVLEIKVWPVITWFGNEAT